MKTKRKGSPYIEHCGRIMKGRSDGTTQYFSAEALVRILNAGERLRAKIKLLKADRDAYKETLAECLKRCKC